MYAAIRRSGRPMVLSVEAEPPIDVMSATGQFGHMRRVGHDIAPTWQSIMSLIDISYGYWPYAHNASAPHSSGFWNDLDMLQVGHLDFNASLSPEAERRCRVHFAMWCIMKAPLALRPLARLPSALAIASSLL